MTTQQARIHAAGPAVSPDGLRIAYSGDRSDGTQVFVCDADGGRELQLTQGRLQYGRPRWSRDGIQVLYPVFSNNESFLFAIGATAGQPHQVASAPGRNPILLADPRRMLFATPDWPTMQLMVANRDGSNAKRISDGVGAIYNAAVSPDGTLIAYTRNIPGSPLSVWVMKLDGTGARPVTNFAPDDGAAQSPAWSRDGKWLAVQAAAPTVKDPSRRAGHIWNVNVTTGQAAKLAVHDEPYLDESPDWFPDGTRLAFQSDRSGRMEIWVMNVDGSGVRQVTR